MATAGMILGIVALVASIIPIIGAFIAVPCAFVGIPLAGVSLFRSKINKGQSITGIITSSVAIVLVVVWFIIFVVTGAFDEDTEDNNEVVVATKSNNDSVATPEIGMGELESALKGVLPTSFEKWETQAELFTIKDLGIDHLVSDSIRYISHDPRQIVIASIGELSDHERIAIEDELSYLDIFLNEFKEMKLPKKMELLPIYDLFTATDDFGLVSMDQIGDKSLGIWSDDEELKIELAMFIRDNYVGLVYVIYEPTTETKIDMYDIARAIDEAIMERLD